MSALILKATGYLLLPVVLFAHAPVFASGARPSGDGNQSGAKKNALVHHELKKIINDKKLEPEEWGGPVASALARMHAESDGRDLEEFFNTVTLPAEGFSRSRRGKTGGVYWYSSSSYFGDRLNELQTYLNSAVVSRWVTIQEERAIQGLVKSPKDLQAGIALALERLEADQQKMDLRWWRPYQRVAARKKSPLPLSKRLLDLAAQIESMVLREEVRLANAAKLDVWMRAISDGAESPASGQEQARVLERFRNPQLSPLSSNEVRELVSLNLEDNFSNPAHTLIAAIDALAELVNADNNPLYSPSDLALFQRLAADAFVGAVAMLEGAVGAEPQAKLAYARILENIKQSYRLEEPLLGTQTRWYDDFADANDEFEKLVRNWHSQ